MTLPHTADALNGITSAIICAAIDIHRTFGPGLFESAYLACLAHDLSTAGHSIELQKALPLHYRGVRMDVAYRADLLVDGAVLVEVKALEALGPLHTRQLRTYLRLSKCRVGLLLNFGAATMSAGVKRVVNGFPDRETEAHAPLAEIAGVEHDGHVPADATEITVEDGPDEARSAGT